MKELTKGQMLKVEGAISAELDFLRNIQDAKDGNRSLSLAITNIEQGLMWLREAAKDNAK